MRDRNIFSLSITMLPVITIALLLCQCSHSHDHHDGIETNDNNQKITSHDDHNHSEKDHDDKFLISNHGPHDDHSGWILRKRPSE